MDPKELERYRPIPRGGLKLLGLLFVGLLFSTICFFLSQTNWEGSPMVVVGRIVGYLVIAAIGVLLFNPPLYFWRLRGYWRLNVRGYDACFWIKNDEGVDPDIGIQVTEGHKPPYWMACESNECGKIFLRVRLGGWFRRRGWLYSVVKDEIQGTRRSQFRAWRIKVRQPITDPLTGSSIEVIDGKGDRIPLTVSETLRFAAWVLRGGSSGFQEWHHEVPSLLRAVRESRADCAEVTCQRDEAKKRAEEFEGKWKTACQQREDALSTIAEAIKRIDATRRFIKSDQAQTIRTWLNGRLAAMAPVGAPGTMLGARETLTQPAACAIVGFGR